MVIGNTAFKFCFQICNGRNTRLLAVEASVVSQNKNNT